MRLARVPPFSLNPEAPVVVRASRLRSGRRMYWCGYGWHCGAGGAVVDLLLHAVTDGGADSRAGIRDA